MSNLTMAELQLPTLATELDARSLYATLQGVTDQRAKRGRRYEAALVLTLIT